LIIAFLNSNGITQQSESHLAAPILFEKVEDEFGAIHTLWKLNLSCKPEKTLIQKRSLYGVGRNHY
jgi:hypothetical protein